MLQKKNKQSSEIQNNLDLWDHGLGLLAILLVVFLPFVPDEKLIRTKLQLLEISILILISFAGIRVLFKRKFPRDKVSMAIVAWFAVALVQFGLSQEKSLAQAELRRVVLGLFAYFSFRTLDLKLIWKRYFYLFWGVSAGVMALYGCLQRTGGVGIFQVPQMDRVMGTFGNPIFFAAYLVVSIFITASALKKEKTFLEWVLFISLVLQVLALYFTQTRAAWLALFLSAFLGIILSKGKKVFSPIYLIVIAVVVLGFYFQTKNTWSRDQGHSLIWRDTFRMWMDHPLKGVGLGAFHVDFPAYAQDDLKSKWPQGQFIVNYAHNEYLQMLAEGGVLYLLGFLSILFFYSKRLYSFWLSGNSHLPKDYLFFTILAVSATGIQNIFSVDMRFGISFGIFFMLLGLSVSEMEGPMFENKKLGDLVGMDLPARLSTSIVLSGFWLALMGFFIFPKLLKPYQAQKEVSSTPSFFDQRLLDPAKSILDLENLKAQYPKEPAILEKLAFVYAKEIKSADNKINLQNAEKAVQTYQELIQIDPKRVSAYNNTANIYYTMGHELEAIEFWEKAVHVDPTFLDAQLNLGKILYVKGKLKEAASHFESVLKIEPGNSEAIVYLKRMVE